MTFSLTIPDCETPVVRSSSDSGNSSQSWSDQFLNPEKIPRSVLGVFDEIRSPAAPKGYRSPCEMTPLLGHRSPMFGKPDSETIMTNKFKAEKKFDTGTAWIIFKTSTGTGMLALPYAIAAGGWYSIAIILLVGIFSLLTCYMLCQLQYIDGVLMLEDVNQISHLAMGPRLSKFSFLIQTLDLFGGLVCYVVLGGNLLQAMTGWDAKVSIFTFGVAANVLPLVLPNVQGLAKASFLGALTVFVIYGIILIQSFVFLGSWGEHMESLPLVNDNIFISFGICLFTFSCHVSTPTYHAKMEEPKNFPAVLNFSFGLSILTQTSFAIFGFLAYGMASKESVNLNISIVLLQYFVSIFIILDKFLSYPILFQVLFEFNLMMLPDVFHSFNTYICNSIVKMAIVISVITCGLVIPHFALVSSLSGCICSTFNIFIFPALWTLLLKKDLTPMGKALSIFIVVFGAVSGSVGTYFTITAIVNNSS